MNKLRTPLIAIGAAVLLLATGAACAPAAPEPATTPSPALKVPRDKALPALPPGISDMGDVPDDGTRIDYLLTVIAIAEDISTEDIVERPLACFITGFANGNIVDIIDDTGREREYMIEFTHDDNGDTLHTPQTIRLINQFGVDGIAFVCTILAFAGDAIYCDVQRHDGAYAEVIGDSKGVQPQMYEKATTPGQAIACWGLIKAGPAL